MTKLRRYIAVLPSLIAFAVLLDIDGPWQLALLLGCGGLFFGTLCATVRNEKIRALSLGIAAILLSLAGLELYLRVTEGPDRFAEFNEHGYQSKDGPLGTAPLGPGRYRSYAVTRGDRETIYDVHYTIGEHGFRQTMGGKLGADTYLFFGGSYTYGHGVEDDETYPARFSEALEYRNSVVNVSFGGYGPHQMLRALEVGIPDKVIAGPVKHVFYLAVWGHVNRAAGFPWWTKYSPHYVVDASGDVTFAGFHDDYWRLRALANMESEGGLPRKLAEAARALMNPVDARVDLTARIVKKSSQIVRTRYGATFTCLFWDDTDTSIGNDLVFDKLEARLQSDSIQVVRVSDLVPGIYEPDLRILPGVENHPGAAAYQMLGYALAQLTSLKEPTGN